MRIMNFRQVRTRLARWIEPNSPETKCDYYPRQATCQIPSLSDLYSRFLGEKEDGTYVEVGAFDGIRFSNTWGLAMKGWSGLLVEAMPEYALACAENYKEFPRVQVVESAVTRVSGARVDLHVAGPLSTANTQLLSEYRRVDWARTAVTQKVHSTAGMALDDLLEKFSITRNFDVLVVDVEGYESEVFGGFNLRHWRPRMMIVELADTHPDLSSTSLGDEDLSEDIQSAGYRIKYKDAINTVFVQD